MQITQVRGMGILQFYKRASKGGKRANTGGGPLQGESSQNKGIGNEGEDLAANYLVRQGFKIVARNVRYVTGEIDIIARKGRELHFVEVRTRTDTGFLPPLETISSAKKRRIRKTAEMYLNDYRNNFKGDRLPICFLSVIGVDFASGAPHIECVLDAFE